MRPDGERMRVVYVTARLPYGVGEPFIVPEIAALERQGCDVTVVPVRREGGVIHGDAESLLPKTEAQPILSPAVLGAALAETLRAPRGVARALVSLHGGRNRRILVKNLTVFPKALWLARTARRLRADHLHAHWAGTSATLALLASRVSGIPWSLTAHRWDIAEDNLLRLKAGSACFVRVISAHGAEELRGLVAEPGWSPWVLHMGVALPALRRVDAVPEPPLRIVTAARLVEKKGHAHLVDAVARLVERGVPVRAEVAGDGPLGPSLRERAAELGLGEELAFLGAVPHEELLTEMAAGRWHAAVLPSVVTASGELEGIPVSLLEAMACGLPAVATATGGIPELLGGGAGLVVPPADADALADAIERLARDPSLRAELGEHGRRRVEEEFDTDAIAAALIARFRECGSRA
ncbi:MAG TPA: glycosyltransferase [Gaiellaceae bacterium]|nr:glycosyltransferase [Gaiellaceae bacterium]